MFVCFLLGVGVVFPKLLLGWFLTYWKRLLPVGSTFTMASELGFPARSFTVFRYTNKSFNVEAKHVQHFKNYTINQKKPSKLNLLVASRRSVSLDLKQVSEHLGG